MHTAGIAVSVVRIQSEKRWCVLHVIQSIALQLFPVTSRNYKRDSRQPNKLSYMGRLYRHKMISYQPKCSKCLTGQRI